ncbi:MAG: signal peptidase I [Clostridia bacterium]|nr:signal peptidase I [Clostridia bacterium]
MDENNAKIEDLSESPKKQTKKAAPKNESDKVKNQKSEKDGATAKKTKKSSPEEEKKPTEKKTSTAKKSAPSTKKSKKTAQSEEKKTDAQDSSKSKAEAPLSSKINTQEDVAEEKKTDSKASLPTPMPEIAENEKDANSQEEDVENKFVKNDILDVEHFFDYKSENEESSFSLSESVSDFLEENAPSYDNLTILGDEEFNQTLTSLNTPKVKQKYDDPDRERYDEKKPRKIDKRFEFVELFIFTLVTVMLLTTFFFKHSVVDGPSMENTLHHGDHLIISDLFYTPERNDVIVCQDLYTSREEMDYPIVKRIIALAGDTVEILPDGTILVNDEEIEQKGDLKDETYQGGHYGPKTVPEGHVFVLGDNRNNSSDSREFGFINENAILGKILFRFYPDFTFINE